MLELLAFWEVTLIGESLLTVNFSAAPAWLELPALWVGLLGLLAPY
jgi:hypothetical protein